MKWIDLFGMVSFLFTLKINVRVVSLLNFMTGKRPVCEIEAIDAMRAV